MLEATGPFEGRVASSIAITPIDGARRLELVLDGEPSAALSLELVTGEQEPVCWRSKTNQHACTRGDPIGLLRAGSLELGARRCVVEGWVEPLGDAWQLDLATDPLGDCEHGVFRATIEP